MKLAAVYFDDTVCIPGGKDVGGGMARQDLRESSFHAEDGWTIEDIGGGEFRLSREGMDRPCIVGGYGYTRVVEVEPGHEAVSPMLRGFAAERAASGVGRAISEESLGNVDIDGGNLLAALGSLNGEAADGQAPGTSADAGSKPAPATKKRRRK
jgi:hypothetical protein